MKPQLLAFALLCLLITACQGVSTDLGSGESTGEPREDFVFVFLLSGPNQDLPPDELEKAFAGHFANMGRLAEADRLLLAGPLEEPKADPNHRGLFVFDARTVDEARSWIESDPAIAAGALAYEAYAWSTAAPMRAFLQHYKDARAELGGEPGMRMFVLASTTERDVATRVIEERSNQVLFHGDFTGGRAGECLVALDAENVDQARDLVGADEWTFYPWFSTEAHLRALPATR